MRVLVAALLTIGLVGVANREASASLETSAWSLDSSRVLTHSVASATRDDSLQLARHCGPRQVYHHRGGYYHRPHHHHQHRRGAYYRGGYGPAYYRSIPVAPYGGSGFGLYIGF